MLGLYIHIPFCSAICNYCNFNRGLFDTALKARYVAALVREMQGERVRRPFDRSSLKNGGRHNILGGGTPSLLDPEEIL